MILTNFLVSPFIAEGVKNIFPSLWQSKDKVILDFNKSNEKEHDEDVVTLEPEVSDIKEFARTHGMNVAVPQWLPEGKFEVRTEYQNYPSFTACHFMFEWERQGYSQKTFGINYELVNDKRNEERIMEISMGSKWQDSILIDGMDAYIFFEEEFCEQNNSPMMLTMYFYDKISENKGILATAYTIGIDKEEAYKIFRSFG